MEAALPARLPHGIRHPPSPISDGGGPFGPAARACSAARASIARTTADPVVVLACATEPRLCLNKRLGPCYGYDEPSQRHRHCRWHSRRPVQLHDVGVGGYARMLRLVTGSPWCGRQGCTGGKGECVRRCSPAPRYSGYSTRLPATLSVFRWSCLSFRLTWILSARPSGVGIARPRCAVRGNPQVATQSHRQPSDHGHPGGRAKAHGRCSILFHSWLSPPCADICVHLTRRWKKLHSCLAKGSFLVNYCGFPKFSPAAFQHPASYANSGAMDEGLTFPDLPHYDMWT